MCELFSGNGESGEDCLNTLEYYTQAFKDVLNNKIANNNDSFRITYKTGDSIITNGKLKLVNGNRKIINARIDKILQFYTSSPVCINKPQGNEKWQLNNNTSPNEWYIRDIQISAEFTIVNTNPDVSSLQKLFSTNNKNEPKTREFEITKTNPDVSSLQKLFDNNIFFTFEFKDGDEYTFIDNRVDNRIIKFTFATGKRRISYTNNKNETKTREFEITKTNNTINITRVDNIEDLSGGNNNRTWYIDKNL